MDDDERTKERMREVALAARDEGFGVVLVADNSDGERLIAMFGVPAGSSERVKTAIALFNALADEVTAAALAQRAADNDVDPSELN